MEDTEINCERKILVCACRNADVVPRQVTDAVIAAMEEARVGITVVDDLCGLAVERPETLRQMAECGDLRIAACFPRAIHGLLTYAGAEPSSGGTSVANMREHSAEEVVGELLDGIEHPVCPCQSGRREDIAVQSDWVPWFPVIDRDRCTNCGTCLSFCLFGVYARGDGESVEVRNPSNCKTNCPACARVCPQGAIMFPKHPDADICGGEAGPGQAKTSVDMEALTSGDVIARLRSRGDIHKLGKELGVPQELLNSVPPTQSGQPENDCDCDCSCDCDDNTGSSEERGGCPCCGD